MIFSLSPLTITRYLSHISTLFPKLSRNGFLGFLNDSVKTRAPHWKIMNRKLFWTTFDVFYYKFNVYWVYLHYYGCCLASFWLCATKHWASRRTSFGFGFVVSLVVDSGLVVGIYLVRQCSFIGPLVGLFHTIFCFFHVWIVLGPPEGSILSLTLTMLLFFSQ